MHLTALVESAEHVCCRYRLEAFQPYLERAGHRLDIRPFPRSWWTWLQIKHALGSTDAVIVQRRLLPKWKLALLRRAVPRLLFDFDDAVHLRDSYSAKGLYSGRRLKRFAHTVAGSDHVIGGNTFLEEEASRWSNRERLHVIPTCVNPADYPLAKHQRTGEGVELVWIGSSSTMKGLQAIRPMLETIGRAWPGVRLKLICDAFLQFDDLPLISCEWSEETEKEELSRADIGLSWLPDDAWSHGKCGLKVLQYMAAGLPVIANPVGVQAAMVRHGETGFLATTTDEWSQAVGRLMHDPRLRRRMGEAGRLRVEEEFSVAAGAALWVKVLDGMRPRVAVAG